MIGALIGSSLIGGISSLMAGNKQAKAYGRAGALQAQAMREALAFQKEQYADTREDLAPYRETGATALGELGALYGVGREGMLSQEEIDAARERFQATPSYDFRFQEGLKALDRSAAARGKLRGGGYGQELQRYGQGLASTEFDNYANRLASLAGVGQSSSTATGQFGAQTAQGVSNTLMSGAAAQGQFMAGAGTARASGYAGMGNAAQTGIQNYLLYDLMKQGGI